MFCLHTDHALSDMLTSGPLSPPPFNQTLPHIHLFSLTSGSDSRVLGGGVSFGGFFSSLCGPTLGGGRWKSLDWSCWALGQGRVPLTHSTGSSQTAFWPWTWKKVREHLIKVDYQQCFSTCFIFWGTVFTLMPSLAPSCRYGMIEWFHSSMNHGRNSATETGHDKKKQGPNGDRNVALSKCTLPKPVTSRYCHVSHLWESLKCCTSPGKCGDGTKAVVPSQVSEEEPGGVPNPAPSLGGLPPLYDAGTSVGSHLRVRHCWRMSTSCNNNAENWFRLMLLNCLTNVIL